MCKSKLVGDDGIAGFASNYWAGSFHKRKRIFLKLKDLATEDVDQLVMCEFRDQDFELLMD